MQLFTNESHFSAAVKMQNEHFISGKLGGAFEIGADRRRKL